MGLRIHALSVMGECGVITLPQLPASQRSCHDSGGRASAWESGCLRPPVAAGGWIVAVGRGANTCQVPEELLSGCR